MRIKVLIIDDEEIQRTIIQDFLQNGDYEIDLADGVSQAKDLMGRKLYGIIITDKNMPTESGDDENAGLEIINYAKKNQPYAEIVMITGYQSVESAVEIMKLGISDYLIKPLVIEEFIETIDKITSYHGFINPDAIMNIYKDFNKDVKILFETMSDCDKESKQNLMKWIDDKIYSFLVNQRRWEEVILEQRDSLSEIGRYGEELREKVDSDDELFDLVEKICIASEKRI